jgi:bifunctional non-homologous end joining protein LigD
MTASRNGSPRARTGAVVRSRRPAARATPDNAPLEAYRARRDFTITREPAPAAPRPGKNAPIFVVQKHDARRLHWDFRLEHDGVLWSWAVPKGPSLDPGDKRLAVHVEDHPLDYAGFHGTIPEGQYGAGTVEIWDRGTWAPVGDAEAGIRAGELKFVLSGQRLNGGFVLVRLKPRPKERAENWLLIKEHDAEERAGADAPTLESAIEPPRPRGKAGVWNSDKADKADKAGDPEPPGAVRAAMPASQAPQLATAVEEPPNQPGWISEVKFDGYRLLVFLKDGVARLVTRNGHDWTDRLPTLARAFAKLKAGAALIDGELVAVREDGVTDFGALQAALSEGQDRKLVFYAFDLLHLDGWDLRPCRLADRRATLRRLSDWRGMLRYSDDAAEATDRMRRQACAMGLEGIVCKRADAPYRAGRTRDWVKVKCQGREEFLVLGWTPPSGSRAGLGALHVGFRDADCRLHYAGAVGTGFSNRELAALRRWLDALAAPAPADLLAAGDPLDPKISWVRPELVGEV